MISPAFKQYFVPLGEWPADVRKYYEYNPEEAKRLLGEAGYAAGFETVLTPYVVPGKVYDTEEFVIDNLSRVGIRAKMNIGEYGAYINAVWVEGKYTGIHQGPTSHDYEVDDQAYGWYHSKGAFSGRLRINDPKVEDLAARQRQEMDPAKRKGILRELQLYLAGIQPMCPLPRPTGQRIITHPWVKNFNLRQFNLDSAVSYERVWVDRR